MTGARTQMLRIVGVLGVLSLFASVLWMLLGDRFEVVRSVGPDTYSKSALGHHALKTLLEQRGGLVQVSRFNSAQKARKASLLIVSEPFLHRDNTEGLEDFEKMLNQPQAVLIILPKRWGIQSADEKTFIESTGLHPIQDVQFVLDQMGLEGAKAVRPANSSNTQFGASPNPKINSPQLIDWDVEPEGALVFDVSTPNTRITLVSDPDIFATHGLDDDNNVQVALDIIDQARVGNGPIVFDETVHGHTRHPSLGRALTEFPMALLTMQFLLLMLLTVWSVVVRFGRPRPVDFGLARGKGLAIENTAELLNYGGYANHSTEEYVWQTVRHVARMLHVAPSLSRKDLIKRLEEVGSARRVEIDIRKTVIEAENLTLGESRKPRRRALLNIAKRIYEWKRQILK